ncbi:D-ribose transporter ATP-binding protein [Haloferula helveola]|uniref:D-ribose transporter ATP-binding protein n=1 Tax=Haloferula helveola TaxID=490095 RepID=A0ABM7RF98_9BACT|nr:D-ribose transporter ATP-binding protein [Haloferula helveola]
MASAPLLEVRGVGKRFGGVQALQDVGLQLASGEVLALLGENGAGKSTLMKILAGVQPPDGGEILLDGEPVSFGSVADAMAAGLALIHQELNLATNLDVAENIFLGREPGRLGWVDRGRMHREAEPFLRMAGFDGDPDSNLASMPIGKRQQVEIAKALSVDARILIMDEPTSSLSLAETERLFEVIRDLKSRGVAVIYISHRLGEVEVIADRVEVLRDGRNAGGLPKDRIGHDAMVSLMVGRELDEFYPRRVQTAGKPLLKVRGLRTPAHPEHEVGFDVKAGEIVGVAGLVGAGRTEVLRALFGIDRREGGSVTVDGRDLRGGSVREAVSAGLALVPEDRKAEGVILGMDVPQNLSLACAWGDRLPGGFRNARKESERAGELGAAMRIKASPDQRVGLLSGGNQQKVALGKWLAMEPKVLLLDEPTRGVDVGAKHEIYALMEDLAERGKAVLFVSSDLPEVLGMADRILVMHEGRLAGELSRDEADEESVMALATGVSPANGSQTRNA